MLPWLHALCALFIAFAACTIDRLVNDKLTAVFWGLPAILLFIYDIRNTFYRIIAFFVIGLVMLVIGFLYHRFRERISALDS